ncbi:MAG: FecR domain-containing protein [Pseudomonadota bacterium]
MTSSHSDPLEQIRAQAVAWLARLRGPTSAADHAAFEDWYCADPRHADVYDALLDNWDAMGRTPPASDRDNGGSRGSATRSALVGLLAASLIAVIGAGFWMNTVDSQKKPGAQQVAWLHPEQRRETAPGSIETIRLPDGSSVTLDTASRIDLAYSGTERRIRLISGRARFAVAHGDPRPFIVTAGAQDVVAHGTLFDIFLQDEKAAIALIEGRIEVRRTDHDETSRFLAPGEVMRVDRSGPLPKPEPDTSAIQDWPSGMQRFTDAPLGTVAAACNRYAAHGPIIVKGALASKRFSGTVDVRDTKAAAQLLASAMGAKVEVAADGAMRLIER